MTHSRTDLDGRAAPRVLVVDDDPPLTDLWTHALCRAGFDARGVLTPDEALALAAEFRPHVAVLDIDLPGIDGRELGRRLRALDARLAIVVVTGNDALLVRDTDKPQPGVFAQLLKPLSLGDLRRLVEVLVALR